MHTFILIYGLQRYFDQRLADIAGKVDRLGLYTISIALPEYRIFVILLAVIIPGSYHSKLWNYAFSGKAFY